MDVAPAPAKPPAQSSSDSGVIICIAIGVCIYLVTQFGSGCWKSATRTSNAVASKNDLMEVECEKIIIEAEAEVSAASTELRSMMFGGPSSPMFQTTPEEKAAYEIRDDIWEADKRKLQSRINAANERLRLARQKLAGLKN